MNAVQAFNSWNLRIIKRFAEEVVDGEDYPIEEGYLALFTYVLDYCIGSPNWKRALYWATKMGYCEVVEFILFNCDMSLETLEDLLLRVCTPQYRRQSGIDPTRDGDDPDKRRKLSIANRVRIAELLCKCAIDCNVPIDLSRAIWEVAGWGCVRLLQVLTLYSGPEYGDWDPRAHEASMGMPGQLYDDLDSYDDWEDRVSPGWDQDSGDEELWRKFDYMQPLRMPERESTPKFASPTAKAYKHPIINAAANNRYNAVSHFLKIDPTLSRYASPEHEIDTLEAFCDHGDPQSFVDAIYDLQKTNDDLYEYCLERLARLVLF
jgi:hypothetical protein